MNKHWRRDLLLFYGLLFFIYSTYLRGIRVNSWHKRYIIITSRSQLKYFSRQIIPKERKFMQFPYIMLRKFQQKTSIEYMLFWFIAISKTIPTLEETKYNTLNQGGVSKVKFECEFKVRECFVMNSNYFYHYEFLYLQKYFTIGTKHINISKSLSRKCLKFQDARDPFLSWSLMLKQRFVLSIKFRSSVFRTTRWLRVLSPF